MGIPKTERAESVSRTLQVEKPQNIADANDKKS